MATNIHSTKAENPVAAELASSLVRERLVHVALSVLRDGTEAEDAAHDAVEQALRGSGSFRAKSLVSTWLHRVVVNAALMRARRRRRAAERVAANDQSGQGDVVALLSDSRPAPAVLLEDREDRFRLHAAVAELPVPIETWSSFACSRNYLSPMRLARWASPVRPLERVCAGRGLSCASDSPHRFRIGVGRVAS